MADARENHDDEPPKKRRRAKVACRPCRERKRKCDGHHPCGTCVQFEYDCYFGSSPRAARDTHVHPGGSSRRWILSPESPVHAPGEDDEARVVKRSRRDTSAAETHAAPVSAPAHLESLEANSSAAFVRRLGLKIDASNAPSLRLFGWNVGERLVGMPPGRPKPITNILSYGNMTSLAQEFFKKVAVVYGCIDEQAVFARLSQRWALGNVPDPFDQVLCGIAALGLHFSQPVASHLEPDLVESARVLLEENSLAPSPTIDTVSGWILRVAYLRMTSTPHHTWMASCSLMHVVEAARVHQEAPSQTVFDEPPEAVSVDIRRRLWGTAQHLNIWASFDLGRTRITLPNATTKPLTAQVEDHTSELLSMIPITLNLDPNQTRSSEELEADLSLLLEYRLDEPPVIMGQINLALCMFRRLRAQKPNMISSHIEKLLVLAKKGLDSCRYMIANHCPWHHAANVPFQTVCMLLAIDSRASIAMLSEALSVLKQVRDTWTTPVMHETYDTAYLLVLLHQRRKEEDARDLRSALDSQSAQPTVRYNERSAGGAQPVAFDNNESMWLDDLFTNVPGLKDFDLDQFLVEDTFNPHELGSFGQHFPS